VRVLIFELVMQVDFSNNYFELFELPVQFDVPTEHLDTRYRSLQRYLHPDKFASASDAERRWSMQAASFVNEAYQCLSSQIKRATYLLSLNGISLDEETDTQMSPAFLMEQMELREAIGDAPEAKDPYLAIEQIGTQLNDGRSRCADGFSKAADEQDWVLARTVVREWQFLEKLASEIQALEARLDDAQ